MRKKEPLKRLLLKAAKKVAEKDIMRNMMAWPPVCSSVLHQPKRPCKNNNGYNI